MRSFLFGLASLLASLSFASPTPANIGFYYGREAPIGALYAYDWVVLQPGQVSDARLSMLRQGGTRPLAYAAVDEMARSHDQFDAVAEHWVIGANPNWDSVVLDVRLPEVRQFILEARIAPALARGFQGVFLDTLDSHRLTEPGKANRKAFADAQAALIGEIRRRFPDTTVVINRGFHLPQSIHSAINALAFESYLAGYDAGRDHYQPVPQDHRDWLDEQLAHWRTEHPDIPLIAIDYTDSVSDAAEIARQLRSAGFIPYVSNGALNRLGPTQPATIRRHVLVLHDLPPERADRSFAHRRLGIFLEQLGLVPHYRSNQLPPLEEPVLDRYVGVVAWWESGTRSNRVCRWLAQQVQGKLPVVTFGLVPGDARCQGLMGARSFRTPRKPGEPVPAHPSVGRFEGVRLPRQPVSPLPITAGTTPWLTVTDHTDVIYSPIYTFDNGGVALEPYLFEPGPDDAAYWLFDPLQFLAQALQLPQHPAITTTTESGRRILTAHIDGDGFVSRAELPGSPLAAQVILDEILRKYRIPHTVSIVEAEVSEDGLYPHESQQAMAVTRAIFREPTVEVASHTYSHPFFWPMIEGGAPPPKEDTLYGYSLDIPGYQPELEREIHGSVEFIDSLAPDHKPTRVFLWSGDARPGPAALAMVRELGLHNVNGGDTRPLPFDSGLAAVWPDGRPVGDELQIYAPVMNENVYTDLWTGPFYGYRNARDSFDLLETPYRLKPSGIYYLNSAAL